MKHTQLINELNTARKQQGITQANLALNVNVAKETISAIFNHHNRPNIKLVCDIANFLNVPLIGFKTQQRLIESLRKMGKTEEQIIDVINYTFKL